MRLNPAAWVVPLVAVVLVVATIAADAAARLFQTGDLIAATLVAASTAASGWSRAWLLTMRGVFRRTPEAYARLRSELLATGESKLAEGAPRPFPRTAPASPTARGPRSKVTVRRLLLGRPVAASCPSRSRSRRWSSR